MNAARHDKLALGCRLQGRDYLEWKAAHGAFGIDVGVEIAGAVLTSLPHQLHGRQRSAFLPALDRDFPATRIDREEQACRSRIVRKLLRHLQIHRTILQQCRTNNDLLGSGLQHFRRRFHAADSAPNLHRKMLADVMNQRGVFAFAHRRIQVDELHHRVWKKAVDPVLKVVELQRLLFSLHKLDDLAAHKIN